MTRLFVVRRAVYGLKLEAQRDPIHFHDPTPVAVAALMATCPCWPMLDTFVEAGGPAAVVRVLGESDCPFTLGYSVQFIGVIHANTDLPGTPNHCQKLANEFYDSGGWAHGPCAYCRT
jgi:hypothetical protein